MDASSWIVMVVAALAVGGMYTYQVLVLRRPVVQWHEALDTFRDAVALVEKYGPAADQLVAIGKLDKDARLGYVTGMVLSYLKDIDPEQVRGIIEWWVASQKKHGSVVEEVVSRNEYNVVR